VPRLEQCSSLCKELAQLESEAAATEPPEIVEDHKYHHVEMEDGWAAGIAAVQMAAERFGSPRCSFEDVYRRCPLSHAQMQLWAIDIAYAVAHYSIACSICSHNTGVDLDDEENKHYWKRQDLNDDIVRVNRLLTEAESFKITKIRTELTGKELAGFLTDITPDETAAAIVLVDNSLLHCENADHPHSAPRGVRALKYCGNYILITGVTDDGYVYQDPMNAEGGCTISYKGLDRARTKDTDHDSVLMVWDQKLLECHLADPDHDLEPTELPKEVQASRQKYLLNKKEKELRADKAGLTTKPLEQDTRSMDELLAFLGEDGDVKEAQKKPKKKKKKKDVDNAAEGAHPPSGSVR